MQRESTMPLSKGCSTKAMSDNISTLVNKDGKPQKQAVAIGYAVLKKACGVTGNEKMTPDEIVASGKGESVRVMFGTEVVVESVKWDSSWKGWQRENKDMAKAIEKDLAKAVKSAMGDAKSVKVMDAEQYDDRLEVVVTGNFEKKIDDMAQDLAMDFGDCPVCGGSGGGEGYWKCSACGGTGRRSGKMSSDDMKEIVSQAADLVGDEVRKKFDKVIQGTGIKVDDIDYPKQYEISLFISVPLGHYGYKPQSESAAVVQFGRMRRKS